MGLSHLSYGGRILTVYSFFPYVLQAQQRVLGLEKHTGTTVCIQASPKKNGSIFRYALDQKK